MLYFCFCVVVRVLCCNTSTRGFSFLLENKRSEFNYYIIKQKVGNEKGNLELQHTFFVKDIGAMPFLDVQSSVELFVVGHMV